MRIDNIPDSIRQQWPTLNLANAADLPNPASNVANARFAVIAMYPVALVHEPGHPWAAPIVKHFAPRPQMPTKRPCMLPVHHTARWLHRAILRYLRLTEMV